MEGKIDNIEDKLDNHLERISKAEVYIKGHSWVIALVVTALLSLGTKLIMSSIGGDDATKSGRNEEVRNDVR